MTNADFIAELYRRLYRCRSHVNIYLPMGTDYQPNVDYWTVRANAYEELINILENSRHPQEP